MIWTPVIWTPMIQAPPPLRPPLACLTCIAAPLDPVQVCHHLDPATAHCLAHHLPRSHARTRTQGRLQVAQENAAGV